jgi:hypothetical protein
VDHERRRDQHVHRVPSRHGLRRRHHDGARSWVVPGGLL